MRARASLLLSLGALLCAGGVLLAPASVAARASTAKHRKKKARPVKLTGGTLTLALSAAAWSHLDSSLASTVGSATTPVAPATATPEGAFSFPIRGGSLSPTAASGTVNATGGMTIASKLSLPGLFSSESTSTVGTPVIKLGTLSTLTITSANFTPPTVALLTLSPGRLKPVKGAHTITLSRIPALLTAAGQQFFGSAFHTGEEIGTVTIASAH